MFCQLNNLKIWSFTGLLFFTVTQICYIFLHNTFKGKILYRTSQWHATIRHFHPLLHEDQVLHSVYLLVCVEEAEQRSDKLETSFTVSEIVQAGSFWIF